MYFCLWNLESWALESGIQPKWNNPDPTKDWDPESKPVNWEMNPDWVQYLDCAISMWRDPFNQNSNRSDREKWSTSKGGPVFSKLFRLDQTDPLSFGPKFPEILVEWIAPFTLDSLTWGDNLVPRFHSVLRWKVRSPFPLAVEELGTRLMGR